MFRDDKPLWMPPGSVRALLALAATGAYFVGAVSEDLITIVWGWYFIQRATDRGDERG